MLPYYRNMCHNERECLISECLGGLEPILNYLQTPSTPSECWIIPHIFFYKKLYYISGGEEGGVEYFSYNIIGVLIVATFISI